MPPRVVVTVAASDPANSDAASDAVVFAAGELFLHEHAAFDADGWLYVTAVHDASRCGFVPEAFVVPLPHTAAAALLRGAADAAAALATTAASGASRNAPDSAPFCEATPAEDLPSIEALFRNGDNLRSDQAIFFINVFAFELWTQWLHPVLLPVVLIAQGYTAARNKGMVGCSPIAVLQLAMTLMGWLPQVLVIVSRRRWAIEVVIISAAFVLFRIIVIAGKYASYPKQQYESVVRNPDHNELGNLILANWVAIPDALIAREFADAEDYVGVDLKHVPLTLLDGSRVSARDYLLRVTLHVWTQPPAAAVKYMIRFIQLGVVSYPLWAYFDHAGGFHYTGGMDMAILVTVCVQMLMFSSTVFTFMLSAVLHYARMRTVSRAMVNAIARTAGLRSNKLQRVDAAMVPLTTKGNIVAWDRMRLVVRNFGRIYANRMSFNTFAAGFVIVFLLLVLLQQAVAQQRDWKTIVFVGVAFVASGLLALAAIGFGSLVNSIETDAAELLSREEFAQLAVGAVPDAAAPPVVVAPACGKGASLQGTSRSSHDGGGGAEEGSSSEPTAVPTAATETSFVFGEKPELRHPMPDPDATAMIAPLRDNIEHRLQTDPVRVMYLPAQAELATALVGVMFSGLLITLQIATGGGVGA